MKTVLANVRLTVAELDEWKRLAREEGKALSSWIKDRVREGPGVVQESRRILPEPVCGPVVLEVAEANVEGIDEPEATAQEGDAGHDVLRAGTVSEAPSEVVPEVALLEVYQAAAAKPTVNQALGHKLGPFRPSPRCENSRCGRLQMALCDPCRQVNKQ